jgi:hypothetical protein
MHNFNMQCAIFCNHISENTYIHMYILHIHTHILRTINCSFWDITLKQSILLAASRIVPIFVLWFNFMHGLNISGLIAEGPICQTSTLTYIHTNPVALSLTYLHFIPYPYP